MSELSTRARAQAKSKLDRLIRSDPRTPVDASGYSPHGALGGDLQTGPRPISRNAFKRGGKILGEVLKGRADRKPRATGGRALVNDFINRNAKDANPGMHQGAYASGGGVHKDAAQDRKLIHAMGCKCGKCSGGRVGRKTGGGNWIAGAIKHPGALHKELHVPQGEKIPAKKLAKAAHSDNENPKLARRAHLAETLKGLHKAKGGAIPDGTRPAGGRLARKGGGRAKKGMNVNIIIAPGSPTQRTPAAMPPPGVAPPPGAGPVGLHQGAPPMPPPGAPPTAGAPMMRKRGGRTYPIDAGAGSGLGRLEKIRAYG